MPPYQTVTVNGSRKVHLSNGSGTLCGFSANGTRKQAVIKVTPVDQECDCSMCKNILKIKKEMSSETICHGQ